MARLKTTKKTTNKKRSSDLKIAQKREYLGPNAAELRLIDKMYDKKGNLTPLGKRVMDHGKRK